MQPLWKTVWRVLKKLKIKVSYNPATPVSVLFLKKRKTLTRKDICTPMFVCVCVCVCAQGYIVWHREYSQYFIIILNGV